MKDVGGFRLLRNLGEVTGCFPRQPAAAASDRIKIDEVETTPQGYMKVDYL